MSLELTAEFWGVSLIEYDKYGWFYAKLKINKRLYLGRALEKTRARWYLIQQLEKVGRYMKHHCCKDGDLVELSENLFYNGKLQGDLGFKVEYSGYDEVTFLAGSDHGRKLPYRVSIRDHDAPHDANELVIFWSSVYGKKVLLTLVTERITKSDINLGMLSEVILPVTMLDIDVKVEANQPYLSYSYMSDSKMAKYRVMRMHPSQPYEVNRRQLAFQFPGLNMSFLLTPTE